MASDIRNSEFGSRHSALGIHDASPLERFKKLYWSRLIEPMRRCEQLLENVASLPAGTLGESCSYTLAAGGKRLRPLLVFLSARAGESAGDKLLAAAAAVELVHMATLVHDDVLDGARLRRGQPTLAAKFGAPASAAAGDYLFSSAFDILASAGSTRAVSLLSSASLGLSMGEMLQMQACCNFGLSCEAYFERCGLKTSGLFAAACQLGALLSGCTERTIAALGEFGYYLGLSFQLSDDILDLSGDSAETGKETGADLRDGTVTLPLILALKNDPSIRTLLEKTISSERAAAICGRIEAAGGIQEARRQACDYVSSARERLQPAEAEIDPAPLELLAEAAVYRRK